jgi:hypothetical protein
MGCFVSHTKKTDADLCRNCRHHPTRRILPIFLAAVCFGSLDAAEFDLTFARDSNSYVCDITIPCALSPDSAFERLLAPEFVKSLNSAADTVYIVHGDAFSDIVTDFSYFTYRGTSRVRRTPFPETDSIAVALVKFQHNWSAIPSPVSIEVYYTIDRRHEGGSIVEYRQEASLNRKGAAPHFMLLKWQFRRFARKLAQGLAQ